MRRTELIITYNSKDISKDLVPLIKGFDYTDNSGGKADDIALKLENTQRLWQGDWFPEKGDKIQASIKVYDWDYPGHTAELPCGTYEVDEVDGSDYPTEFNVKAISIPIESRLTEEDKTKAWEKIKLSAIAADVAKNAELEIFYDTDYDKEYDRVDQSEQSDLAFLQKLCDDNGLALKVADGKIVIFDEWKYEQTDPVMTIEHGKSNVKSVAYSTRTREIYSSAHVKYTDSAGKTEIEYTFTAPDKAEGKTININQHASKSKKKKKGGKTLKINQRVTNIGEAERLAKKQLRDKNKDEWKMSFGLMGEPRLLGGVTVLVKGWGKWDGKYFVETAKHSPIGGYTTNIEIRRCLEGY